MDVSTGGAGVSPAGRERRPLSPFDRFVRAPLGLLYLGFLLLLAVPVCAWMTLLYAAIAAGRALRPGGSGGTRDGAGR